MSIASGIFWPPRLQQVSWFQAARTLRLQGFSIDLGAGQNPLTLDYNRAGGFSAAAAPSNRPAGIRA